MHLLRVEEGGALYLGTYSYATSVLQRFWGQTAAAPAFRDPDIAWEARVRERSKRSAS